MMKAGISLSRNVPMRGGEGEGGESGGRRTLGGEGCGCRHQMACGPSELGVVFQEEVVGVSKGEKSIAGRDDGGVLGKLRRRKIHRYRSGLASNDDCD